MNVFTFRKDEILRKKKSIDQLFNEGASFFIHPFRIFWLDSTSSTSYPAQILVSVSKRNFKRAVDRNRIRRQIREIYRVSKQPFYEFLEENRLQCTFAIIYTARTIPASDDLRLKIKEVLARLINEMNSNLNNPSLSLSENINNRK
jgi:ribonuclease P protein component